MIKAIIFDLGGTLRYQPTIKEVQEKLMLSLNYYGVHSFVVDEFSKRISYLLHNENNENISQNILAVNILDGIFRDIKIDVDATKVAEFVAKELCKISNFQEDTENILNYLKRRGYKLALLSNTVWPSYIYREEIAKYLDSFSATIFSDETLIRKPNQEAFRIARDRLGEKYENILMVGDSVDNDISPAKSLGMRTILIGSQRSTKAEFNLTSINEILNVLGGIK